MRCDEKSERGTAVDAMAERSDISEMMVAVQAKESFQKHFFFTL